MGVAPVNHPKQIGRDAMKRVFAVLMSAFAIATFATATVEAQTQCPPEVAKAKEQLNMRSAKSADTVQAPRSLAGARQVEAPRGQDVQAPRGQDVQAPRGQAVQAPRGQDVQAPRGQDVQAPRSEEHTSELQSQSNLVCRLLLEKKKNRMDSEPGPVEKLAQPRRGEAVTVQRMIRPMEERGGEHDASAKR